MTELERRRSISELWKQGNQNCTSISETLNISARTVRRVVCRLQAGIGIERQKGSGAQPIWGETDHRRLGQIVRYGRMKSIGDIQTCMIERGSPAVSWSTVRRELNRLDYSKQNGRVTPLLSDAQKHRRLTWCHQHENFNWDNVMFSDECSIWAYPSQIKCWAKTSQVPLYQRPKHSQKFHAWGGVSLRGTTPLCVFTGNMTSEMYTNILEGHLLMSAEVLYPDGFIFQQDNDPKHTAKTTKAWFQAQNITVLEWPSYSPDLNPIENVWALMKQNISKRGERNIEVLKQEAQAYWDTLTHQYIQSLVESMPRRIQACITAEGGITSY